MMKLNFRIDRFFFDPLCMVREVELVLDSSNGKANAGVLETAQS